MPARILFSGHGTRTIRGPPGPATASAYALQSTLAATHCRFPPARAATRRPALAIACSTRDGGGPPTLLLVPAMWQRRSPRGRVLALGRNASTGGRLVVRACRGSNRPCLNAVAGRRVGSEDRCSSDAETD